MFNMCITKHLQASETLSSDEAYLMFVTVHPTTTDGEVIIKKGDDLGDIVFKAKVKTDESSKHFNFDYPIRIKEGIYVELNNVEVTVGYFG